jgi:signal transduction histidine kinase
MECLNNRRLLVVDDQEVIHFSFRSVFGESASSTAARDLSNDGYEVDYATTGEQALELVRRGLQTDEPHVLAFIDMYMPDGWDGVETISRLWDVSPELQIVLCTAFTDYTWSQIITRLGKTDQLLILKKPFDKIEVRQLARGLTEKWRLARQVRLNITSLEEMVAARTGELARANARLADLIHELVAARDAAEAASRAKTEFLANISHEIRTPMTAIVGYADMLAESQCPPGERVESATTIRRHADQLLTIIDDLLDISKLEAGRMTFDREQFSPRDMALEVVSLLHVRAEEKNLRLATEFPGGIPPKIESDPFRMRQILLNLVGNAIKFTEIGEVRIAVSMPSGSSSNVPQIAFEVTDTGIGMSAEVQQNLFDCFRQGDMSAKRRFRGIGLGLAISKRLARILGGDITVTSSPGMGSTFRLVVPVRLSKVETAIPINGSKPSAGQVPVAALAE